MNNQYENTYEELMTLSKEEEEFLLKYRQLNENKKNEVKSYVFSFEVDNQKETD